MGDVGPEVNGLSQGSRMSVVAVAHQMHAALRQGAEHAEKGRKEGEVDWR